MRDLATGVPSRAALEMAFPRAGRSAARLC
jgi:hypothetical protein